MANKGAWTGSISSSGGSCTVPAGYHNGSGKVTGPTLAALVGSNVTATSNAHILSGYTAYGKNGVKYTGSDKGYNNGYSAGRTQGQNDVKNSPNSYGLYSKSQYDSNWSNGYNSGKDAIYTGKSGSFSTDGIGSSKTIGTGLSEIRLLVCYVNDGTNGMLNWSATIGQRCVRGNSWINDIISVSGGNFTVNARNSNYASRSWQWHAIGK